MSATIFVSVYLYVCIPVCLSVCLSVCVSVSSYTLPRFIPVLMQQCVIYWDMENYAQVEKILQRSVEFCMEDDTWKLSCAHVLFMQAKYKEAAEFYQSIFKRHYEQVHLLSFLRVLLWVLLIRTSPTPVDLWSNPVAVVDLLQLCTDAQGAAGGRAKSSLIWDRTGNKVKKVSKYYYIMVLLCVGFLRSL